MTKARAKPPRASRSGAAPSRRELFRRAARLLGVSASDYERADILAQIAELLMRSATLGQMLAFKGGAVMTLIDGSPRLSADLDAVVVTGRAVRDREAEIDPSPSSNGPVVIVSRAGPFVRDDLMAGPAPKLPR